MQLFQSQPTSAPNDLLLKTAIGLYQKDRDRSDNERTVEQVLAELDIPENYLRQAKLELAMSNSRALSRKKILHGVVYVISVIIFLALVTVAKFEPFRKNLRQSSSDGASLKARVDADRFRMEQVNPKPNLILR